MQAGRLRAPAGIASIASTSQGLGQETPVDLSDAQRRTVIATRK